MKFTRQLVSVSAVGIPLILFMNFTPLNPEKLTPTPNSATELYEQIGLSNEGRICGDQLIQFQVRPGGTSYVVLSGPTSEDLQQETWHRWNPCLKALVSAANQKIKAGATDAPIFSFLRKQLLFILSRPQVRFYLSSAYERQFSLAEVAGSDDLPRPELFDRVVYLNKLGLPYDAFSQADLGYLSLQAHSTFRDARRLIRPLLNFFCISDNPSLAISWIPWRWGD